MAPELMSSEGIVDTAADIYSFGMLLYEMVVGQEPFSDIQNGNYFNPNNCF